MKKAFTLAEVLIVIITQYKQMKVVTTVKSAIAKWNNVYKFSFNELGEPTYDELKTSQPKQIWNKYYAPYISVTMVPTESPTYAGYNKIVPFAGINGGIRHSFRSDCNFTFYTNDGLFYFFQSRGGAYNPEDKSLVLDINGPKGPNIFGKDVFEFTFYEGEGIFPICKDYTADEVNKNCSKSGVGQCCAEKIRRDGWKITKDYPW
jgi:hypothetical protein